MSTWCCMDDGDMPTDWCEVCCPPWERPLPIIVVDGWLLFPGGFSRKMTLKERYLHWRGKLVIPID